MLAAVAAESLDVAVEKGLAQLNCTHAEADVEVLQRPSSGLFGLFGKQPARVRIKLHARGVIARQFTSRLLQLSALDAEVELFSSGILIELKLTARDPGRLIGRHGQTLEALQSLVSIMTDRLTTDRTAIIFDVDGYRERRLDFLNHLARRLSCKVRQSGRPVSSPPLVLGDRRIVYEWFKQEPDLEYRSRNHAGGRKIIIVQLRG